MKHPFPVTLTLSVVLITILWNILRVWTSIAWKNVLIEFSASIAPSTIAVIGAVWVILGCIVYWGIWQKKAWAGKMLNGAAAGFTVWYWSERLLFQNPRPNILFAVIVNLGLLILFFFTTTSLSREAYERKIEHPNIE